MERNDTTTGYAIYTGPGGPVSLRYAVTDDARDRPDDEAIREACQDVRTDAEDDNGLCWP